MSPAELVIRCREILASSWPSSTGMTVVSTSLEASLLADVRSSINSRTKTYRYVLPTQLLAKAADPTLDCRCLQSKRGGPGAFDARSLASKVVVPFDRDNYSVLGGSTDPYVNNVLRCEAVSQEYRKDKKDGAGWDALCRVLDEVEKQASPDFTQEVLQCVLAAIRDRLQHVHITYSIPNRISQVHALALISEFLQSRSGGSRFQCVVAAAFATIGSIFGVYAGIRRSSTNSADSQSGSVADVECVDESGTVVAAVEAKDRVVTIRDLQDKLPALREQGVREAYFLTAVGTDPDAEVAISELLAREFTAGQNLYVLEYHSFLRSLLALLREDGRRDLLQRIGAQLDAFGDLEDRTAWAALLAKS